MLRWLLEEAGAGVSDDTGAEDRQTKEMQQEFRTHHRGGSMGGQAAQGAAPWHWPMLLPGSSAAWLCSHLLRLPWSPCCPCCCSFCWFWWEWVGRVARMLLFSSQGPTF